MFEKSWLGYGNNFAAPAAAVQYFNINLLNDRVRSLETSVESLMAEIKALKAAKP